MANNAPWMTEAHRLHVSLGFVRDPSLDWAPTPDVSLLGFRLDLADSDTQLRPWAWDIGRRVSHLRTHGPGGWWRDHVAHTAKR